MVATEQRDYLLVKNFNIVFEAIIDELIGDKEPPRGLKDQDDGKRVDHIYSYRNLTNNEEDKPIIILATVSIIRLVIRFQTSQSISSLPMLVM